MFQKTHFKLPSGDWKRLVWKGEATTSHIQISHLLCVHVQFKPFTDLFVVLQHVSTFLYLWLLTGQITSRNSEFIYCRSASSPGRSSMLLSIDLLQVILAEVLCDCSSSQAVVKELRVSASPLEQRKFLAESEPYRWVVQNDVLSPGLHTALHRSLFK